LCTGAVGALTNFIERAGVACTSISLVREQSEAVGPTRALWVPFALGRPLGSAEDSGFQKNVMRQAFALLDTATEPTIADYAGPLPEEAGPGQWACPLNLGPIIDDTLTGRLLAEVGRLKTWSAQTRTARGRTLFGVSGAGPEQIDDVARALAWVADADSITDPPAGDIEWAFDMPLLIRHLADDLRTFYHEAIAAQPGSAAPNHDALNDWIFGGTALGDTLQAVADRLTQADDPMADLVRGLLIPEGRYQGGSAF
jgi:hypothetical protein